MEKKKKTIWVDDGRPLADMSGVSGPRLRRTGPSPRFKEVWKTYWGAVKMMFLPMLAVMVILGILYMILYFIFSIA